MRPFVCSVCGQLLFFDNSRCLRCRSELGFVIEDLELVAVRPSDDHLERLDGRPGRYRRCSNQMVARCNWLVDDGHGLCRSCRLTSIRPNDSEQDALAAFADAETAKRRLLYQLRVLDLPIVDRSVDPHGGLTFNFLSSRGRHVTTGHDGGVITLDLSESDDAHREFVRQQLGEPYRTVLGHLRHEIGHYFWPRLVLDGHREDDFRALFGDERIPYEDALAQHYGEGGELGQFWNTHVSQYATMHPWEDWAETFANYLHIQSGLETAAAFGLTVGEPARSAGLDGAARSAHLSIGPVIQDWLTLTIALNGMSRSIGQGDLYPFVLSPTVVGKLDFVHAAIGGSTGSG